VFAVFPATGAALVFLAGRSESESHRWMHDLATFLDPNYISGEQTSNLLIKSGQKWPLRCLNLTSEGRNAIRDRENL
jgi:hypothetical protein